MLESLGDNSESSLKSQFRGQAIFLLSIIGLYLELLLIRWIGTEVRIFAYLQNTLLVACFLGLGIGFFTCRLPATMAQCLRSLLVLLALLAFPFSRNALGKISEFLSVLDDFVIWGSRIPSDYLAFLINVAGGLILTFCMLVLVVDAFVPLGRFLGRWMQDHSKPLVAYSINIAGSLAGTWLFVLVSFFWQPPLIWFVILAAMVFILSLRIQEKGKANLAWLAGIILLAWFAGQVPGALQVTWSPYQKLVVYLSGKEGHRNTEYFLAVNNTGYQEMIDLSEKRLRADGEKFPEEMHGLSQYDLPLLIHPAPKSFLIVGAGSGNDAAGGLRHGVKDITAVEIDLAIISIGRRLHPEQPYSAPAVQVVNDDARSFFATTTKKFDVISFGLLDSHTTNAMANARLDHFVYTRESIHRAKELLAEGGVISLTFEAQKPFIADRMAKVLQDVFGEKPIVFRIPHTNFGWGGVMFLAGDLNRVKSQIAKNPRLGAFIEKLQKDYPLSLPLTTIPATDDWPYIYLSSPRIPVLFYLLAGLMILLFFYTSWRWKASSLFKQWHHSHWHFFFLGAAFLLLEVQNISKASVVLGNTWETNAPIISGVLIMALFANWVAQRFPGFGSGPAYGMLIAVCVALYFVDLARFAFLPYAAKVVVVGGLTTLPMFFSGIIFARSFATIQGRGEAMGANIFGALAGALLQSVTFVVGIKALLLIVAGLYLFSWFFKPPGDGVLKPITA